MLSHKDILQKLEELERNDIEHYNNIQFIIDYLMQFEEGKKQEIEQKKRPLIGFKPMKE